MADGNGVTLMEAARSYLAGLSDDKRIASQAEVEKFVRWCGADRICEQIRGHEVANYAEVLTGTVTDASSRADAVRKFLASAKKAGHTSTNLGAHLRLKKTSGPKGASGAKIKEVEMSADEQAALTTELESLKAQRPGIVEDIRRAMSDKDFRENAPLDAAKQQQGYIEGRIRKIESQLDHAVIVTDRPASSHIIEVGSTVVLRNLGSDAETTYTLVRPGEVDASKGRISFQSPVGQALLTKRAGEEVEVSVPSGTVRFRIERVEG